MKSKAFVYLFDVTDGNPNGDPKMNNSPRLKLDGRIWVTSESQKRKVRNYWEDICNEELFVTRGPSLNSKIEGLEGKTTKEKNASLLKKYIDARVFGAVASTGKSSNNGEKDEDASNEDNKKKKGKGSKSVTAGVVHGPVQIFDAVSINKPDIENTQLTRVVSTTGDDNHTMGTRYKVDYAVFKGSGHVSVVRAEKSGMTEKDEKLFFEALENMFVNHSSNSSGIQRIRKIFVFERDATTVDVGSALDAVNVELVCEFPTSFDDVKVSIDKSKLPKGMTVKEIL